MGKFRITFDVDLSRIYPEAFDSSDKPVDTSDFIISKFLEDTRKNSLLELRRLQKNHDLPDDIRRAKMADCLRTAMLTNQAQANLKSEQLPDDVVLPTDIPSRRVA